MSIEREDCSRCGGTGQITRDVVGRTGLVSCPACDNVPEYAVPDDPPEAPRARLVEIEQELKDLEREKQAWKELRSDVTEAKDLLGDVADSDLLSDETCVKLDHIRQQIGWVLRSSSVPDQAITYEKQRLGEERMELKTYLEHVEGGQWLKTSTE